MMRNPEEIILIEMLRHGQTYGNLKKQYIGRTDEPLCTEGMAAMRSVHMQEADFWVLSPMIRCLQSALLIADSSYSQEMISQETMEEESGQRLTERLKQACNSHLVVEEKLRECDFGVFEGKSYLDLSDNRAYQSWIRSGGTEAFPGGEDPEMFRRRCRDAFLRVMHCAFEERAGRVNFIIHGGCIMSILSAYACPEESRDYYGWMTGNAEGYRMKASLTSGGKPILWDIRRHDAVRA